MSRGPSWGDRLFVAGIVTALVVLCVMVVMELASMALGAY